jgi:brefeldin A-resistance guanine nucleotide exchange factor 1
LTVSHPDASRQSFALILKLASSGPAEFVQVDNFAGIVTLLDDFATTAGTFTESQQHHGRRSQPLNASKYVKAFDTLQIRGTNNEVARLPLNEA